MGNIGAITFETLGKSRVVLYFRSLGFMTTITLGVALKLLA